MKDSSITINRDLVEIISNLPPSEFLERWQSIDSVEYYLFGRFFWESIKSRLDSFFSGSEPPSIPTEIAKPVELTTQYLINLYCLLFESWNYLKPVAISRRLIPADSHPKDYMRLMLEQEEYHTLELHRLGKLPSTNRTKYTHASDALKMNDKLLNDIDLVRKEENRITRIKRNRSQLFNLLLEVAADNSSDKENVRVAALNLINSVNSRFEFDKKHFHHRQKPSL